MLAKDNLINHLFFRCPVARVTWGIIALCFQQRYRPASYDRYWPWVMKSLRNGDDMYMFGLTLYARPPGKPGIGFVLTKFFCEMWVKFCSMLLLLCAAGQGFTRRRLNG
jgi:hypothetical protein